MNVLPPMKMREFLQRVSTAGKVSTVELLHWQEKAQDWLQMESAKALRSANSWERKGKPDLAASWRFRAEFAARISEIFFGER